MGLGVGFMSGEDFVMRDVGMRSGEGKWTGEVRRVGQGRLFC